MKSLADFLGVIDPKDPNKPLSSAPSPKVTAKSFSREVLNSAEYRQSLLQRIMLGELPPHVECLLYHYAYGKPVERVEVEDVTPSIDNMTAEQCEQRALYLAALARKMREKCDEEASEETTDTRQSSVH